jgi:hypothetical protein
MMMLASSENCRLEPSALTASSLVGGWDGSAMMVLPQGVAERQGAEL